MNVEGREPFVEAVPSPSRNASQPADVGKQLIVSAERVMHIGEDLFAIDSIVEGILQATRRAESGRSLEACGDRSPEIAPSPAKGVMASVSDNHCGVPAKFSAE